MEVMMNKLIAEEIVRFVAGSPEGEFPEGGRRYFDPPLVGFSSADDPLFVSFKDVIGAFHLLPAEILPGAATVISWILPIAEPARVSNRTEERLPSRDWAITRGNGEKLNVALRRHLTSFVASLGGTAVAPQLSEKWQELIDAKVGIASTWSERHAAYAAGLGTFSLNDGLITSAGIAHRIGSIVTDLLLDPSPRPYSTHTEYCLFFDGGKCGACIRRCPVDALSGAGHDKLRCREMVYGISPRETAELYGVQQTGCGLCHTAVPCEGGIPRKRT